MLTILVCLKPIRGSCLSNKDVNPNGISMNPYDIPVLENAIRIKKKIQNCRVICISMGVEGAKKMLSRCIALGADQAILLNDLKFAGSDTYATSYILSEAVKKIGSVDIIACGAKTLDGETGQVPIEIATRLNMKYVPYIEEIIAVDDEHIIVNTISNTRWEKSRIRLPAVAIFSSFVLTEPVVSLFSLKRSQQKPLMVWNAEDLDIDKNQIGQEGSKTKVVSVKNASRVNEVNVIQGSVDEKCVYIHSVIVEGSL